MTESRIHYYEPGEYISQLDGCELLESEALALLAEECNRLAAS